jgi:beta-galactosidase
MLVLLLCSASCARSFAIVGNEFQMDGQAFRYISGTFHYFRQHPDGWEDTIKKMATGGLNAIQTYVAWNIHEPSEGNYNFKGLADIERFLTLCKQYNMYVILRPGPYICAEWDFGGFPGWLTQHLGANQFRRNDATYLKYVDAWLKVLFQKVAPFMYLKGGPIIVVQIENEYGYFDACDQKYLQHLADLTKAALGNDTVLITNDDPKQSRFQCGGLKGVALETADYGTGTDISSVYSLLTSWNNGGPLVTTEYWTGWLDYWGSKHETRAAARIASDVDTMLSKGASVNMYMYFGGTNFGFNAGAGGDSSSFDISPTSYDYDAPLSESGDMTYKWEAVRTVIKKYRTDFQTFDVKNNTRRSYGKVTFSEGVSLFEALDELSDKTQKSDIPLTFEGLGASSGFVLYRGTSKGGRLNLPKLRDRATVFVNEHQVGTVQRPKDTSVTIGSGPLDILVENQGRINFGTEFVEEKGLPGGVQLDGKALTGWTQYAFDFGKLPSVTFSKNLPTEAPALFRAVFEVDVVADTYLNPKGLVKGLAFVNGFNLGRYWTIGPQLTLYVPKYLLKVGQNELVIFEQESTTPAKTVSFDDTRQISII